jgi:hypothetical protein
MAECRPALPPATLRLQRTLWWKGFRPIRIRDRGFALIATPRTTTAHALLAAPRVGSNPSVGGAPTTNLRARMAAVPAVSASRVMCTDATGASSATRATRETPVPVTCAGDGILRAGRATSLPRAQPVRPAPTGPDAADFPLARAPSAPSQGSPSTLSGSPATRLGAAGPAQPATASMAILVWPARQRPFPRTRTLWRGASRRLVCGHAGQATIRPGAPPRRPMSAGSARVASTPLCQAAARPAAIRHRQTLPCLQEVRRIPAGGSATLDIIGTPIVVNSASVMRRPMLSCQPGAPLRNACLLVTPATTLSARVAKSARLENIRRAVTRAAPHVPPTATRCPPTRRCKLVVRPASVCGSAMLATTCPTRPTGPARRNPRLTAPAWQAAHRAPAASGAIRDSSETGPFAVRASCQRGQSCTRATTRRQTSARLHALRDAGTRQPSNAEASSCARQIRCVCCAKVAFY